MKRLGGRKGWPNLPVCDDCYSFLKNLNGHAKYPMHHVQVIPQSNLNWDSEVDQYIYENASSVNVNIDDANHVDSSISYSQQHSVRINYDGDDDDDDYINEESEPCYRRKRSKSCGRSPKRRICKSRQKKSRNCRQEYYCGVAECHYQKQRPKSRKPCCNVTSRPSYIISRRATPRCCKPKKSICGIMKEREQFCTRNYCGESNRDNCNDLHYYHRRHHDQDDIDELCGRTPPRTCCNPDPTYPKNPCPMTRRILPVPGPVRRKSSCATKKCRFAPVTKDCYTPTRRKSKSCKPIVSCMRKSTAKLPTYRPTCENQRRNRRTLCSSRKQDNCCESDRNYRSCCDDEDDVQDCHHVMIKQQRKVVCKNPKPLSRTRNSCGQESWCHCNKYHNCGADDCSYKNKSQDLCERARPCTRKRISNREKNWCHCNQQHYCGAEDCCFTKQLQNECKRSKPCSRKRVSNRRKSWCDCNDDHYCGTEDCSYAKRRQRSKRSCEIAKPYGATGCFYIPQRPWKPKKPWNSPKPDSCCETDDSCNDELSEVEDDCCHNKQKVRSRNFCKVAQPNYFCGAEDCSYNDQRPKSRRPCKTTNYVNNCPPTCKRKKSISQIMEERRRFCQRNYCGESRRKACCDLHYYHRKHHVKDELDEKCGRTPPRTCCNVDPTFPKRSRPLARLLPIPCQKPIRASCGARKCRHLPLNRNCCKTPIRKPCKPTLSYIHKRSARLRIRRRNCPKPKISKGRFSWTVLPKPKKLPACNFQQKQFYGEQAGCPFEGSPQCPPVSKLCEEKECFGYPVLTNYHCLQQRPPFEPIVNNCTISNNVNKINPCQRRPLKPVPAPPCLDYKRINPGNYYNPQRTNQYTRYNNDANNNKENEDDICCIFKRSLSMFPKAERMSEYCNSTNNRENENTNNYKTEFPQDVMVKTETFFRPLPTPCQKIETFIPVSNAKDGKICFQIPENMKHKTTIQIAMSPDMKENETKIGRLHPVHPVIRQLHGFANYMAAKTNYI